MCLLISVSIRLLVCHFIRSCDSVVVVGCPARKDLAISTRKATEEAAQVQAGPQWEGQRKEESDLNITRYGRYYIM